MTDSEGEEIDTFAAARWAWDKGIEEKRVLLETERTQFATDSANLEAATAQLGQQLQQDIAQGKLAEAIAVRKEKALIDDRRDDLQIRQLKVNTLLALAQPATMLFVQRFNLLDDLGAALGINFDEEGTGATAPFEIAPRLVERGTIPTMRMLQNASVGERQLMLAEVAADAEVAVSPETALERIQQWTPGSQPLRRQVMTGQGR